MTNETNLVDEQVETPDVQPEHSAVQSTNDANLEYLEPHALSPLCLSNGAVGNYRRKRNETDQQELKNDILAKKRILQSIIVRETAKNGKEVVAGYGRWQIASELWDEHRILVPTMNVGYISDTEALEIAISENLKRSDVTVGDLARAASRYLSTSNGDFGTAALKLQVSEKQYREYLQIGRCASELIDALDDSENPVLKGHCLILSQFPKEVQLATLQSILSDPKTYTVQHLKSKAKSFEFSIGDARFDTDKAGCHDCKHNSEQQFTIFQTDNDAKCSNAQCYLENQNKWLEETKIPQLRVEYGTVLTTEQKPVSDVKLVSAELLGKEQANKCASCKSCTVLVVNTIGADFGKHRDGCCIDLDCYSKHYDAFTKPQTNKAPKKDLEKSSQGKESKSSSAQKSSSAKSNQSNVSKMPSPKLTKRTERTYANMIQKAASEYITSELSDQFALAVIVKGLSNSLRYNNQIKETIPQLIGLESDKLKMQLQNLLKAFMEQTVLMDSESADRSGFEANKVLRTIMTEQLNEDSVRERAIASWTPSKAIWQLHTKAQIAIICNESGFESAYDKKHEQSSWAKVMNGSVSDIIDKLTSFQFDWSHYAPPAYIEMALKYKPCN